MAANPTRTLLRTKLTLRNQCVCPQCRAYAAATSSTTLPPAAPMLIKIKNDLKAAMKEKDTNRLNVLRGLLAEVTNAAKTNTPIKTDMQVLALLRKRKAAAKAASEEFKAAGREDLVEKEEAQVNVLDSYAGEVKTMTEEDVKAAVTKVVDEVKAAAENAKINMGDVLKKLMGAGGSLEGKPVDRSEVARIVKQTLGQ